MSWWWLLVVCVCSWQLASLHLLNAIPQHQQGGVPGSVLWGLMRGVGNYKAAVWQHLWQPKQYSIAQCACPAAGGAAWLTGHSMLSHVPPEHAVL